MGAKGTDSFAPAWQNTGQVYGECPASPPQRLLCEITTRFLGKDKRTLYATRIDATPRISLNAIFDVFNENNWQNVCIIQKKVVPL